jgi:hypothetical protein
MLLTWVPLLVLSAVQGLAMGHRVELPFLYDFAAYTRFLVAVPLLILAEGIEGQMAAVAAHFVKSGLVPERNFREGLREVVWVNPGTFGYDGTVRLPAACR